MYNIPCQTLFEISCVLIVFNCPVSVFLSFLEYGWHRNPSKAFYQAFQSGSRLRESKALSDRYSTVLVWPRLIWTSVAFVCHLWLQALLTAHAWLQCGQDVFISSFYSHVIMSFQEMFRGFEGQRRAGTSQVTFTQVHVHSSSGQSSWLHDFSQSTDCPGQILLI